MPTDMQRRDIPLLGPTERQPDPVGTPPPVEYNVNSSIPQVNSATSSQPLRLNKELHDIGTMPIIPPSGSSTSTTPAPKSWDYVSPCAQTFDCPSEPKTPKQPTASAQPAQATQTSPGTIPGTGGANASTTPLSSFAVTKQDVSKVRTASSGASSLPVATDVWAAVGKPDKLLPVPEAKTMTAARPVPYLPRRSAPAYVPESDGSAEFAQYLGIFLLGVAQGMVSSGPAIGGGGGGYRGRVGGPCDYWTSHASVCRSIR